MKLPRRQFLHLAGGAAALPILSHIARAEGYPTRPVRWIVPFAPGGSYDTIARLSGQWLSDRLGQQFIIEDRSGGGSNIGTEAVVHAAPDGYTLLLANDNNAVNATLYQKLNFVFTRDIMPVAAIAGVPNVMAINPAVPATSVPQFISYAKSAPGRINMASGGVGSPAHMSGELFKMATGVNLAHVPYRGGAPAITDLMGGQVQVMFSTLPQVLEYIRSGRLRALAVTTAARSQVLPGVPTIGEFVPGYENSGWTGIGVPTNTPTDVIQKLNLETNKLLADPKIIARLSDLGLTPLGGSPADFRKLIAAEVNKWAKVVKFAGIKAD
jgi:tripartite-type tricarboxylate transporter receptor subunit TctC